MTMTDRKVFESLTVVTIRGYQVKPEDEIGALADQPGSANYFCDCYGMSADELSGPGILWLDYDLGEWDFAALIASDEVDALCTAANEGGYEILKVEPVTEPTHFGDSHAGTVEICQHRDGWVVLN